jgi:hypothetical protein
MIDVNGEVQVNVTSGNEGDKGINAMASGNVCTVVTSLALAPYRGGLVLVSIVREHMLTQFALFVSSCSSVRKMNGAHTALRLTVTLLTSLTRGIP